MSVPSAVRSPSAAVDRALAAGRGAEPVAAFLDAVAPGQVLRALRHRLAPEGTDVTLDLLRAKLKPERKLTAEYDVALPSAGVRRRIAVTWVAPGAAAPGPAADEEAEARRRGVLAPFRRSWAASDDGRMSVTVAPVDRAFPQLVRLHDPRYLADVLRSAGAVGSAAGDLTVAAVRYRPGQRHVLRIGAGAQGPALFAKVYRDETGRRSIEGAARAARIFAAAGDRAVAAAAGGYLPMERTTVWPEVTGSPLGAVLAAGARGAGDLVGAAGSALRLLHQAADREGLPACPRAEAWAGATLRSAEVVAALLPAVGARLRREVDRAVEALDSLPAEPPTLLHGDVKCDNLLVHGARVHLLDFDRSGLGDPAADLGNFLADLRWWTDGDGPVAARLHEALLQGYGATDGGRLARARVYDALSQLRMAARRVPVQDPAWEHRVVRAVGIAAATLAGEPVR